VNEIGVSASRILFFGLQAVHVTSDETVRETIDPAGGCEP
jgi:hypothetical protein